MLTLRHVTLRYVRVENMHNANCTCEEIPTIPHSPICSDNNADFLDVGIESLVSLFDECEAPVNESDD